MRVPTDDRVRILYVAGLARTGSTIIGQTLGGLPDVTFVGELSYFWRRFANGESCSCRRPLPDCPFWSNVVSEAYGTFTRDQAKEIAAMEQRVLRRQWLLGLVLISNVTETRVMLNERTRLYRAIVRVARTSWVVDTGKNPMFGNIIARLGAADVGTVHIVRDPRGVAFSWMKHIQSDSEPGDMDRQSPAKTAVHWLLENLLIQLSLQKLSKTYIRVSYEDFVTRLPEVVREISFATGIAMGSLDDALNAQAIRAKDHHLVAGNPGVRAHLNSSIPVVLDEEWQTKLPRSQRWLVTAICASLMAAYGYSLRVAGDTRRSERTANRCLGGAPVDAQALVGVTGERPLDGPGANA
jgi:hypothetical protein